MRGQLIRCGRSTIAQVGTWCEYSIARLVRTTRRGPTALGLALPQADTVEQRDVDSAIGVAGREVTRVCRVEEARIEQHTPVLAVGDARSLGAVGLQECADFSAIRRVVVLVAPAVRRPDVVNQHSSHLVIVAGAVGGDPEIDVDAREVGVERGTLHPLVVLEAPSLP